jgi:polyhydroxybutyrate depolymerase
MLTNKRSPSMAGRARPARGPAGANRVGDGAPMRTSPPIWLGWTFAVGCAAAPAGKGGSAPGDTAGGGAADGGGADGAAGGGGGGWAPTLEPCVEPGVVGECALPGYPDRPCAVFLPAGVDRAAPTPLVVNLHGGGGEALGGWAITCPDDGTGSPDLRSPACLHRIADAEGFVAVFPNGTGTGAAPEVRTWNAGGGEDGWHCVSGEACLAGVDDEAYLRAVLAHVEAWLHVDRGATFATGLSNGAALAHRAACTMADRFVAVAPVGGANQCAALEACAPVQPVAVLHIHGDADPCWTCAESDESCAPGTFGRKVGAWESTAAWAARNGCGPTPTEGREADVDGDGGGTRTYGWAGCEAEVSLLRLEGAGHTCPGGFGYQPAEVIGTVSHDWDLRRVWSWFDAHRRP